MRFTFLKWTPDHPCPQLLLQLGPSHVLSASNWRSYPSVISFHRKWVPCGIHSLVSVLVVAVAFRSICGGGSGVQSSEVNLVVCEG